MCIYALPDGNRIAKEVFVNSLSRWTGTYYVHDAQGNIMATYQWLNRDTFNLDELVMYGSSRLGTIGVNNVLCDTALRDSAYYAEHDTSSLTFTYGVTYSAAGLKQYEFTNHLGNVLLTLTDRHIPVYLGTSFLFYKPEVASAQDYYPFGMLMPGRVYRDSTFRFGFNNKEKDDETYGQGNEYNYGFRIFNPRLGRFVSTDPLFRSFPWNSTYAFAENDVIRAVDLEGLEKYVINQYRDKDDYITKIEIVTVKDNKSQALINQGIIHGGIDYSKKDVLVIDHSSDGKLKYLGRNNLTRIQKSIDNNHQGTDNSGTVTNINEGKQNLRNVVTNRKRVEGIEHHTYEFDTKSGSSSSYDKFIEKTLNNGVNPLGSRQNRTIDEYKFEGADSKAIKDRLSPQLNTTTKEKEIPTTKTTGATKIITVEYEEKSKK